MRQDIWGGSTTPAAGPSRRGPGQAWADYALGGAGDAAARPGDGRDNAGHRSDTVRRLGVRSGAAGSRADADDLDYHLSTLFPPVRLRGYLEIRYLDAMPYRWWPALAALVVTLVDDDVAADRAAELCSGLDDSWTTAARDGLGRSALLAAARGCAEVAAERCPAALRSASRPTPSWSGLAVRRVTNCESAHEVHGPLRVLEEVTDA